jgi:hypothetical protein
VARWTSLLPARPTGGTLRCQLGTSSSLIQAGVFPKLRVTLTAIRPRLAAKAALLNLARSAAAVESR